MSLRKEQLAHLRELEEEIERERNKIRKIQSPNLFDFLRPRIKLTYRTAHVEVEDEEDWKMVKKTVDRLFKAPKKKEVADIRA